MTSSDSLLSTVLALPFHLRGASGHVTIRYGENRAPARWGFDILRLPFDVALTVGFPVCQAEIAYDATGCRAMMGWIQAVAVRDAGTQAEDVSMDLLPIQAADDTPFSVFGYSPTFFDAPGPNPPRTDETWLANTFLAVCSDAARTRHISALLGFRWGYILRAGHASILPVEPLADADWNERRPFLQQQYPAWRFAPHFQRS